MKDIDAGEGRHGTLTAELNKSRCRDQQTRLRITFGNDCRLALGS